MKRHGISEMTNLLTETFEVLWSRQGNQIVCEHHKSPVCLDALPGPHKHVAEGQVLLDVLVKDFDSESLAIKSDHLGFAHFQVVGNEEPRFFGASFGDKQKHSADFWQMDDSFGDLEPSLFGNTDGFVSPRSLGQVTDDSFRTVYIQNTIAFDRSHKCPAGFDNRNENRGTGVPAVHQYGHGGMSILTEILKNFLRQLDFAFEFALGAGGLGSITFHSQSQPFASHLQDTSHSALTFDQAVGRVVNAQTLDMLAFSGTGGVVDSDKQLRHLVGPLSQKILVGLLKPIALLGRTIEETLQVVGKRLGYLICNFASRMKFDKPYQPYKVNQDVFDLWFRYDAQETFQNRRCFLWEKFSHGFRALLGCHSIGDFGRKPFYLNTLSLSVT